MEHSLTVNVMVSLDKDTLQALQKLLQENALMPAKTSNLTKSEQRFDNTAQKHPIKKQRFMPLPSVEDKPVFRVFDFEEPKRMEKKDTLHDQKRFTKKERIKILNAYDSSMTVVGFCRRHNITPATFYLWVKRYPNAGIKIKNCDQKTYSMEFKRQVLEGFDGSTTLEKHCKNHEIYPRLFRKWALKYQQFGQTNPALMAIRFGKRRRFSVAQKLHILNSYKKEKSIIEYCKHVGISTKTFYEWRRHFQPMIKRPQ